MVKYICEIDVWLNIEMVHLVGKQKKENGGYLVSVRAPLQRKSGADELVSQFATGGGRKAAAGINHLPEELLGQFIIALDKQFQF